MPHAQPDDVNSDTPLPLARCPVCGVRVSRSGLGCPNHGPISRRDAGPVEASAEQTGVLPIIPGYRMTRWLGRGGFGIVVAAERETDGKLVAIKAALAEEPDAAARLIVEIDALRRIGPPTVPEVIGAGALSNGAPYVVMEHVSAPTLAARLAEQAGAIPLPRAASWIRGILDAVHAIHERGYVHADLKPENIFIRDDGKATVIDFGLAVAEANAGAVELSAFHAIGTSEYMAPEQCEGNAPLDRRTDVYTLGVIIYEILCGRPPFLGASETVRQSHVSHRPPRLSSLAMIPPVVEDVVLRCLAKPPADRFQTVADLRRALLRALDSDVVRAMALDDSFAPRSANLLPPSVGPASIAPGSGGPASAGPNSGRKRIRAALAFFETKMDAPTLERTLRSLGGELGSAAGKRVVALFSHETEDNPARAALVGVRELIKRKICTKARLDIASVSVQVRPNGARRYVSPLFAQTNRFPTEADPDGPWLSPAMAEVLHENDVRSIIEQPTGVSSIRFAEVDTPTIAEVDDGGPIWGRQTILDALVADAVDVARRGPPRATRVIGGEGLGKTHLLGVLARRLSSRAPQARVISMTARAGGAGEALVAHLLRAALPVPETAPADGGREWIGAALEGTGHASAWPAVALTLGWLRVDAPELRALAAAPGALRQAIALGTGALLRFAARKAPLLVLLDDAHLADETLLGGLEIATLGGLGRSSASPSEAPSANGEAGASIGVFAFGRPAFEETRPSWGERAACRETHRLDPLDKESAAALCRMLLLPATDVPSAAIERLVARAQAVPMLLVELVRGLKREGIVRPRAEGKSHFLATDEIDRLPDLPIVEWLAEREISTLAPTLAAHARLLAVLADDVGISEIEGVLRKLDEMGDASEFPLDGRAGVQRLLAMGMLVRSAQGSVRFRHPLVRESIAQSIPEAMRLRIHRAALEYYQRGDLVLPEELLLSRLATHAAGAGERTFAELTHLSLADRKAGRQRYLEAEIHYSRSLELSAAPAHATYRSRGIMRCRLGRQRDGIADFEASRALAVAEKDPLAEAEILLDEAEALDWVDDYGTSAARVEAAHALARTMECPPLLSCRLLLGAGRSLHRKSLEPEAAELIERAIAEAERLGDDAYETLIISLLMQGFILQGLGRLDRATAHLDRAIQLADEHGDLLHLGSALSNRALLRALCGDKQGMVEGYGRVATIARELGQPFLELVTEFNLGEYLHLMDDLDGAEPHVRRAIQIEERRSGAAMLPSVELLRARFALYRGDRTKAAEVVRKLRERQAEAVAKGAGDSFFSPSDDVLCSMIELATGAHDDAAWDDLEQRSARFSVGQEQIEVLEWRGLSALADGRIDEACERLSRALALAERIPNCMRGRIEARLAEAKAQAAR